MNPSIGLQIYSVRNELQRDYVGTLEKVAAIGYKNLELITSVTEQGLVFGKDMTPAGLRRQLERLGLSAVSCHLVLNEAMNWERIIADAKETGVTALVCAIAFFADQQDLLKFCRAFNRYAELCHKNGLRLYYHNHFHEYQVFEGKKIMDTMIEQLDKDLVFFEFDSYWAIRGGEDPVAWLQKLGTRCDMLHQKDLPVTALPVNWLDVLGANSKITFQEMGQTQDPAQFAEIGEGIINIPAIIEAGRSFGNARYIFVERDQSLRSEFESITISFTNLTRLLKSV